MEHYVNTLRAEVAATRDGMSSIHTKWHDCRENLSTNPAIGGEKAKHKAPRGSVGTDQSCWPSVFEQNGFPALLHDILMAPCQIVMQGPRAQLLALRSLCLPVSGLIAKAAFTAPLRQAFWSPACSASWE